MNNLSNAQFSTDFLSEVLSEALSLAHKGYRVFPIAFMNKNPAISAWPEKAASDQMAVTDLFSGREQSNLAIVADDLLIIDIDVREDGNGYAFLPQLIEAAEENWDAAPCIRTPSGGEHRYFRLPSDLGGLKITQRANVLGAQSRVDVRTGNSYVLVPPSLTEKGKYHGVLPPKKELPEAPLALLKLLFQQQEEAKVTDTTRQAPVFMRKLLNPEELSDWGKQRYHLLELTKKWNVLDVSNDEDWRKVMFALAHDAHERHLETEEAWQLLEWWSQTLHDGSLCPSYNEEENRRRFEHALTNCRNEPISFGTIVNEIATCIANQVPKGQAIEQLQKVYKGDPIPQTLGMAAMNRDFAFVKSTGRNSVETGVWSESDNKAYRISDFREILRAVKISVRDSKKPFYIAEYWLNWHDRREVFGLDFSPSKPEYFEKSGKLYINEFRGFDVEKQSPHPDEEGQELINVISRHILERICRGKKDLQEEIIRLLVFWVQNPHLPGQKALVLRGGQGTGKSLFGRFLGNIFGPYSNETASSVIAAGRFNGHLRKTILLVANEAFFAGNHDQRRNLKSLITDEIIMFESKRKDAVPGRNCVHLVMTTNEDWAVPAEADDRRFVVLDIAPRQPGDEEYFSKLAKAVQHPQVAAYFFQKLKNFELGEWHPSHMRHITQAIVDQKIMSLEGVEKYVYDVLQDGVILRGKDVINPFGSDTDLVMSNSGRWRVLNKNETDLVEKHIHNYFSRKDPLPSKASIAKRLKQCMGIQMKKIKGERTWLFPPLDEARRNFERYLKSEGYIHWDDE